MGSRGSTRFGTHRVQYGFPIQDQSANTGSPSLPLRDPHVEQITLPRLRITHPAFASLSFWRSEITRAAAFVCGVCGRSSQKIIVYPFSSK